MIQRKRFGILSLVIILGLILASCGGGGVALQGEGGLGVELPGGDGQESGGDGSAAQRSPTPLMWALIVAAVFALAAAFFRGGMR
ncbi:MAG: hypothetical protein R3191_06255 [Anaerolineales bacterium]|nr:hypothetical protein [Anaerolineales bacterium]